MADRVGPKSSHQTSVAFALVPPTSGRHHMDGSGKMQTERLRDVVTKDHVMSMLLADRGKNAGLISWKIRDFTGNDNELGYFVVTVDVRFLEGESEQVTCYGIKIDPSYISEIFEESTNEPAADDELSSDSNANPEARTVSFSLGSLDECQSKDPIDMVTDDQIASVLECDRGSGVRLISWDIPDFSRVGDPFNCHFVTLDVIFREKGSIQNHSYVAKYNPKCSDRYAKQFIRSMLLNEIYFYKSMLSRLNSVLTNLSLDPLNIQECFYISEKTKMEMMFFEDLKIRGFKKVNRWNGMSMKHLTLVLRELAKLHAASILLSKETAEAKTELNARRNLPLKFHKDQFNSMIKLGIDIATEVLRHGSGYKKISDWLVKHEPRFYDILKKMLQNTQHFCVTCHGHCWDDNVLFRYDDKGNPTEAMLVNFQWSRPASLVTDLSFLLLTSLDNTARSFGSEVLLSTYFEALRELLDAANESPPFSFQQLCQEYEAKLLFGMIYGLMFIPSVLQEEDETMNVRIVKRRMSSVHEEEEEEESEEDEEEDQDDETDEDNTDEENKEVFEKEFEGEPSSNEGDKIWHESIRLNEKPVKDKEIFALCDEHFIFKRYFALFDELDSKGIFDKDLPEAKVL